MDYLTTTVQLDYAAFSSAVKLKAYRRTESTIKYKAVMTKFTPCEIQKNLFEYQPIMLYTRALLLTTKIGFETCRLAFVPCHRRPLLK